MGIETKTRTFRQQEGRQAGRQARDRGCEMVCGGRSREAAWCAGYIIRLGTNLACFRREARPNSSPACQVLLLLPKPIVVFAAVSISLRVPAKIFLTAGHGVDCLLLQDQFKKCGGGVRQSSPVWLD